MNKKNKNSIGEYKKSYRKGGVDIMRVNKSIIGKILMLTMLIVNMLMLIKSPVLAASEKDVTPPWGRLSIVNASEKNNISYVDSKDVTVRIYADDDICLDSEIMYYISTTPISDTTRIDSGWEKYTPGATVNVEIDATKTNIICVVLKDAAGNTSLIYKGGNTEYTVQYNANYEGATADAMPTSMDTKGYFGQPFVVTTETPTREGYYFLGWSTYAGASEPSYRQGQIIPASAFTGAATTIPLYAVWTRSYGELPLLADVVSVGDYVDYPVYYDNVNTHTAQDGTNYISSYNGWRVLSKDVDLEGKPSPGTVNLVSAGTPLTYYHHDNQSESIAALTTNFLSTPLSQSDNYAYRKTGFNPYEDLDKIFTNKYTAMKSDGVTPNVRAMTLADIRNAIGDQSIDSGTYVNDAKYEELYHNGTYYWLATACPSNSTNLYRVDGRYCLVDYDYGAYGEHGVRPVVSLKPNVKATGTNMLGEWNIEAEGVIENLVEEGKLKVGDYVDYTPDVATYKTVSANTGADSVTLKTDSNLKWRVIHIDEETGEVTITTEGVAHADGITLNGAEGFVNGPTELHNISAALYSNRAMGVTAKSMTVEDLNKATGYTPQESTIKYAYYPYGTTNLTGETEDGYIKTAHGYDIARFYSWEKDGDVISSINYKMPATNAPIKLKNTYYNYNPSSENSIVGSIFGSSYGWLASRCVTADSSIVHFRIFCINNSSVGSEVLSYSRDDVFSPSSGLRPVVVLGSSMKVTGKDTEGSWTVVTDGKTGIAEPKATKTSYEYTGSVVTLSLTNFDEDKMIIEGNTATQPGKYIATVSLKEPLNTRWATNGNTAPINITWEIKATIDSMVTASGLAVGDYVAYKPDTATYETVSENTGSNSVTLTTDSNLKWRILDIDEETGDITITTEGVAHEAAITLSGAEGFVNGPTELHNISEALYSNKKLGINARSMTVEELNEAFKISDITAIDEHGTYGQKNIYYINTDYVAGTTDGYSNKPHTPTLADGWTEPRFYAWDDENGNTIISTSENIYKVLTSSTPVKVTNTCYEYNPQEHNITISDILGGKAGWLASQAVGFNEYSEYFSIRHARDIIVGKGDLGYSYGSIYSPSLGLRPVVTLPATYLITGKDSTGAWTLEKNDNEKVYATLYTDGTLGFSNDESTIAGKTVAKSYGDISRDVYTAAEEVPWHSEVASITKVDFVNDVVPQYSTAHWFHGCTNLTTINNINNLYIYNVTSMEAMFDSCTSLTTLDLSSFDTRNVTNMHDVFARCSSLVSVDVSSFNTSKVTTMWAMFFECISLTSLDLSNFDTTSVLNMTTMFFRCESLKTLNVSNFNTSNVTSMENMFVNCLVLESLDISSFDTNNVTDMRWMFYGSGRLEEIYVGLNWTTKSADTTDMFVYCGTDHVCLVPTSVYVTLYTDGTLGFSHDTSTIAGKTVSKSYGDITNTEYENMDYVPWIVDGSNTSITTVDFVNKVSPTKSTAWWFMQCSNINSIKNITNLYTCNVTNMTGMFCGCYSLQSIDLTGFDVRNVTSMSSMFNGCGSLATLDVSNWDTSRVTDMACLLYYCTSLKSVDLSSFDTRKAIKMYEMFYKCENLTTIYVGQYWNTDSADSSGLFDYCGTSTVTKK